VSRRNRFACTKWKEHLSSVHHLKFAALVLTAFCGKTAPLEAAPVKNAAHPVNRRNFSVPVRTKDSRTQAASN